MSQPFAADVVVLGIGGPLLTSGAADPSQSPGLAAAKGSQYLRADGIRWTKVGDADTDWLPPSAFINPTNGDIASLVPGMPVVLSGATAKRANASSVALSTVIGIVFKGAAITLESAVVTGGACALTTVEWDAVTGDSGGLTPGATYWLGTTVGALSLSPPAMAGQSICAVGRALSPTTLQVAIQAPVLL